MTRILALDVATKTGFARNMGDAILSGSLSFALRANDGPAMRWVRFRTWLNEMHTSGEIGALYVEQPIAFDGRSGSTTLVLGGFFATLELWAHVHDVPLTAVAIGTIKKHWTGKGSAKKPDMVRVARERGFRPKDDNEADALALLDYAMNVEGTATPTALEAHAAAAEAFADLPF